MSQPQILDLIDIDLNWIEHTNDPSRLNQALHLLQQEDDYFELQESIRNKLKFLQDPLHKAHQAKETAKKYLDCGQYHKAITNYSISLELNPDDAESYSNRALSYIKTGKYEEAIQDCNSALLIDEANITAYHRRGIANVELKQFPLALIDFNSGMQLDPENEALRQDFE